MATTCAHEPWDVWTMKAAILGDKGEGKGTSNSQLYLLSPSWPAPFPVSQLLTVGF